MMTEFVTILMINFGRRIWQSPILMTWGNLGIKLLGFAILLPLLLNRLTVEEANLWLFFQAVQILQSMADFGFTPTFIRTISYARSGKEVSEIGTTETCFSIENSALMPRIISTMSCVYNRLSLMLLLLMVSVGSMIVMKPISQIEDNVAGWLAWLTLVITGILVFRGGKYTAYLQGINQIALHQRWQIIIGAISTVGAISVLTFDGGLLPLVAIMQVSAVIGVVVTRKLAIQHVPQYSWPSASFSDPNIMKTVWSAAWRSGLGVIMTYGTIQGAGIIYALIVSPSEGAAFLLAQRVIRTLSSFANAPFYTQIPRMSKLFAEGRLAELVENARLGMLRTNWVLVAGIAMIGFTAEPLLVLAGSQTPFVSMDVWWLLGLATLIDRIGAMHLQLYSITNHIVWHIANGVTGAIILCLTPIFYMYIGTLGLPLGILIGYAVFYVPYSINKSYSMFSLKILHMDGMSSIIPALLISYLFWQA